MVKLVVSHLSMGNDWARCAGRTLGRSRPRVLRPSHPPGDTYTRGHQTLSLSIPPCFVSTQPARACESCPHTSPVALRLASSSTGTAASPAGRRRAPPPRGSQPNPLLFSSCSGRRRRESNGMSYYLDRQPRRGSTQMLQPAGEGATTAFCFCWNQQRWRAAEFTPTSCLESSRQVGLGVGGVMLQPGIRIAGTGAVFCWK